VTGAIDIRTGLRGAIAIAVLAAAFALPAQAFAQNDCSNAHSDPTAAQYCPQSDVLGEGAAGNGTTSTPSPTSSVESAPESTPAPTTSTGGSLPFTGLDIGMLALAAVALTGAGLLLRRLTAPGAPRS
jgi:hypothetical protein